MQETLTPTKKFQPVYDLHLISKNRTIEYLSNHDLILCQSLKEYKTINLKNEVSKEVYYNVKELVEFMKNMHFEMVPGYPNTKTKHSNMLCSQRPTMLIPNKYTKLI